MHCIENIVIIFRESEANLFFRKVFKQNPMHLFWIACKRVIMDFYNDFKNKRQIHVKNAIFSKTVIKLFTIFK